MKIFNKRKKKYYKPFADFTSKDNKMKSQI